MSTAEIKYSLHSLIETISDSKTLKVVYSLLSKKSTKEVDFWDELSDAEKAGIERGLKDIKEGRVVSYETVMKKVKSKLGI